MIIQGPDNAKPNRRMAAEAIARTRSYKAALTESFMSDGKWPAMAPDAGLPRSNAKAGGAIRDISADERGAIIVAFDGNFAEGALLQLAPQADPDTYQARWRCRTSGGPDLKRDPPDCSQG